MIDQSAVQIVVNDAQLLARILGFIQYDYLKECRCVNRLWRFESTRILRSATRVCVNELNVDLILFSNTILGLSLHIRWSPFLTNSLKMLLQKYCRYVQSLSWFMESSGMVMIPESPTSLPRLQLAAITFAFPSVKELHFLFACRKPEDGFAVNLIGTILGKCPQVEKIRLEAVDSSFTVGPILISVVEKKLTKLSCIHLGPSFRLYPADLLLLTGMEHKLTSFSWDGGCVPEDVPEMMSYIYDGVFSKSFLKSLDTLRLSGLRRQGFPKNQFLLRSLSIQRLNFATIVPLSSQFPMLEDLSFSFDQDFNWESWIPSDMTCISSLKSLKWLDKQLFTDSSMQCFLRLFEKMPAIEKLSCPANDKFLEQIITRIPHIKKLELSGDCTDFGVTGIPEIYCSILDNLLESGHLKKTKLVLKPYRQHPNICDLHELTELTFLHTKITDEAVVLAISVMDSLRKVYVTGVSVHAIAELLYHSNIKEIGIPQPLGGTIHYEDIALLKNINVNTKIITGWDSKDFPK